MLAHRRRMNLLRYASPPSFYPLAGQMQPWFAAAAAVLAAIGLWLGFAVAPTDFQQGEVYRIIFIHVPSAWMAMFIYLVMAGYAQDLRNEVVRLIASGRDDAAIKSFLVDRYGEFVLYRPTWSSRNALLWVGPFLLLMIGALAWWQLGRAQPAPAGAPRDGAPGAADAPAALDPVDDLLRH